MNVKGTLWRHLHNAQNQSATNLIMDLVSAACGILLRIVFGSLVNLRAGHPPKDHNIGRKKNKSVSRFCFVF